jgi:hypothetical protein
MLEGPDAKAKPPGRAAAPQFGFPALPFGPWAAATGAVGHGNPIEALANLSREWLDFIGRRAKEDLGFLPRLSACRSAEEIQELYWAFWQKLVDDYWKELMGQLGNGAAKAVHSGGGTAVPPQNP